VFLAFTYLNKILQERGVKIGDKKVKFYQEKRGEALHFFTNALCLCVFVVLFSPALLEPLEFYHCPIAGREESEGGSKPSSDEKGRQLTALAKVYKSYLKLALLSTNRSEAFDRLITRKLLVVV
jgi:hypothetical protein